MAECCFVLYQQLTEHKAKWDTLLCYADFWTSIYDLVVKNNIVDMQIEDMSRDVVPFWFELEAKKVDLFFDTFLEGFNKHLEEWWCCSQPSLLAAMIGSSQPMLA